MIPHKRSVKRLVQTPSQPSVNLYQAIDGPGQIYYLYLKRLYCRIFLGTIFIMLSFSFEVTISLIVGHLIKSVQEWQNGDINDDEYFD